MKCQNDCQTGVLQDRDQEMWGGCECQGQSVPGQGCWLQRGAEQGWARGGRESWAWCPGRWVCWKEIRWRETAKPRLRLNTASSLSCVSVKTKWTDKKRKWWVSRGCCWKCLRTRPVQCNWHSEAMSLASGRALNAHVGIKELRWRRCELCGGAVFP